MLGKGVFLANSIKPLFNKPLLSSMSGSEARSRPRLVQKSDGWLKVGTLTDHDDHASSGLKQKKVLFVSLRPFQYYFHSYCYSRWAPCQDALNVLTLTSLITQRMISKPWLAVGDKPLVSSRANPKVIIFHKFSFHLPIGTQSKAEAEVRQVVRGPA